MIVFGGLVAQSVEQCPFKALVESSSLSQPTSLRFHCVKPRAAAPKRSVKAGEQSTALQATARQASFNKRRAIFRAPRKMSRADFPPTRRPTQPPTRNRKTVQTFAPEIAGQFSLAIFAARENQAHNTAASKNPRAGKCKRPEARRANPPMEKSRTGHRKISRCRLKSIRRKYS